jgi:selenocysteine lyase/cysteine desulfurase
VFNRKFDSLIDSALAEDWGDARAIFKGHDLGLRAKMSAGMRFLANRSLYNEPDDLWDRMSDSYSKRNNIIHRGENATEDEARQAIAVARSIVSIMNGIQLPNAQD